MSALTSSQIQAVLLETVNTVVPKMFESGDSTMMLFEGGKKLLTTTRSFRQPLMMYPGGNYRYVDFESDYGRGSAYQPVLATSVPVERLVATELTARIPMLTNSPEKSVLNLVAGQMQNAVDEWRTMTDRDVQGSGNGVFATIAAGGVSGTTLTLASPFYEQGMRVNDIYYVQDSGQTLTRGSFSVVSIDEINHTIVISSLPAGTVAGDVLVIEGYGVATTTTLQGIAYHQSNASTGTWENLSRVTYPYIRTPSINASGTITVAYLQKLILQHPRDNRERFTLFFFLVGNGLGPETAALWTLLVDARQGITGIRPIAGAYSDHAHRQIAQLQEQVANGTLFKGQKDMMDLAKGYVIKM